MKRAVLVLGAVACFWGITFVFWQNAIGHEGHHHERRNSGPTLVQSLPPIGLTGFAVPFFYFFFASGEAPAADVNLPMRDAAQEPEDEEAIELPHNGASVLIPQERPLMIYVKKSGSYTVGGKTVDLDNLHVLLRETYANNPERKAIIRGDADVLHSKVAAALAACSKAGFPAAAIAWKHAP